MEEEMSALIDKVLTEISKDELISALKILEKMSYEERQELAKTVQEIEDTTNH